MAEIKTFRALDTWRVATDAVELTHKVTTAFPDNERFGLVSQMRRAAVSMPSNIAEVQGLRTTGWALRHIKMAIGSSCELDT